MHSAERGKFITLEGIEGAGKSLQLEFLVREFERRGIPCLRTHEPGGTPFGSDLRAILLRTDGNAPLPLAELLLYLADRFQHWEEVIRPALAQGLFVLCDRYHDASLAYQGHARELGFERVDRLAAPLELGRPDLTLVLDMEVEVGLDRARQRDRKENRQRWGRVEAEDLRFHRRVREGYRRLARREPERMLLLDASGQPEEIHGQVLGALVKRGILSS